MLDINYIREHTDAVKAGAVKKHIDIDIDRLLELDDSRKTLQYQADTLRAEQKKAGQARDIERAKSLKVEIQSLDEQMTAVMEEYKNLMLQVPQVPHSSVPDGASDEDNVEVKTRGEQTTFDFEPQSHIDLMVANGMVDFERGAKVHGFRGYYLIGDGARLSWAIWNYANQFFGEKGFVPMLPPAIVREENLYGTGHLPNDVEDIYQTQDGDYLAGTAEVPVMGYFSGEVLDHAELPYKYLGFSPCYRREAGSYGKDTKGLIRVQEFYKLEQVIVCQADENESIAHHERLNRNTEEFIESLGIPYHTVLNCGGDLGQGQVKKYDIELWVPGEQKYREISSASYFLDFQTRRFNIRYKNEDWQMQYTHSLNCTAIPTPRILVSLVENFQQADGSIVIPEVLRPFMGGREKIG